MISANDSEHNALPSLQELRRKTNLTSRQIAEAAGVSLRIEYVMEIGGSVEPHDAERVLEAFSRLTGQPYSLKNVQVHLLHRGGQVPTNQPAARKSIAPTIRERKHLS